MRWHESKFWKGGAILALVLLAGIFVRMAGEAGPAFAQDQAASRSGADALNRETLLREAGLILWDGPSGKFITVGDYGATIGVWELGATWKTSKEFRVVTSRLYTAEK